MNTPSVPSWYCKTKYHHQYSSLFVVVVVVACVDVATVVTSTGALEGDNVGYYGLDRGKDDE